MRKIPTLFQRDPADRAHVLDAVTPGCEWVLAGEGVATRKYDGTCVMLDDDGEWWARREVKPGKKPPPDFQPEEHDETTGKTVGWEPIEQSPFAKFHTEALGNPYERRHVGTYELLGPKINGNPERVEGHVLWWHNDAETAGPTGTPRAAADVKALVDRLGRQGWEGIVWHHPDGRMAKLKARDLVPDVG